jgi:predicted TIM-barrel fold metal-dependent hydrolase
MRMVGFFCLVLLAGFPAAAREPILDVHLHASAADEQGPPPLAMCTPIDPMPTWDQTKPWAEALTDFFKHPTCKDPIWSPMTDAEILRRSLAAMERHNVIGIVNDSARRVAVWKAAAPDRVLGGIEPTDQELADPVLLRDHFAKAKASGATIVIGEMGAQYGGVPLNSPTLEELWSTAEALDLPVSLHVGPGPPGAPYLPGMGYRAALSSPLAMEDVLVRHPKLRVNLMHAGYPLLDDTLALLYAHPQVYVDLGVIVYTQPRAAFYRYLRALVEAGFGKRILFGSDQMVWPEAIERSIDVIQQAPFLSPAQKRDIFYDNAARFLRLDAATIARHHTM